MNLAEQNEILRVVSRITEKSKQVISSSPHIPLSVVYMIGSHTVYNPIPLYIDQKYTIIKY